jgi:Fe-S-cluster containining protein
MLLMYVLFLSTASAFISHHPIHRIRTNHLHISATTTSQDVWWKEGVNFKCTGCGKCCMNDGEVWLDVDEFHDLCSSLNMTYESALDQYVESIQSNWVKLKSKGSDITPGVTSQCIFLADDGKQCSIYSSRPAQCRSYPYWPRLLSSPSEFNDEGVLPDGMGGPSAKHWSPRDGGCEGINHENATLVSAKNIYRNLELYKSYTELFPFMANGDDKNRLLGALDVVHAVTKSTRAWVNEFVVKYDLCPFARSVFESDRVRYRVFLGSDMTRLQQRVRYEVAYCISLHNNDRSIH